MSFGASSIGRHLVNFKSCFTKPTFGNFLSLSEGWLLCLGRHSISRVIQFMNESGSNHARFYRFFLVVCAIVVVWYVEHGQPEADVARGPRPGSVERAQA